MKTYYKVTVGQRYIKGSKPQDATACAISRAIVESDEDIIHANVNRRFINITRYSTETIEKYRTPLDASNFIDAYDAMLVPDSGAPKPKPFTLALTERDWIGDRPRRMNQREKSIETANRQMVAAATGRKSYEVKAEEVGRGFDSDGFARTAPSGSRATRRTKPQKKWAHRESVYASEA